MKKEEIELNKIDMTTFKNDYFGDHIFPNVLIGDKKYHIMYVLFKLSKEVIDINEIQY